MLFGVFTTLQASDIGAWSPFFVCINTELTSQQGCIAGRQLGHTERLYSKGHLESPILPLHATQQQMPLANLSSS